MGEDYRSHRNGNEYENSSRAERERLRRLLPEWIANLKEYFEMDSRGRVSPNYSRFTYDVYRAPDTHGLEGK